MIEAALHGIEIHFRNEIPRLQHFSAAHVLCLYSRLDSGLKLLTLVLVLPGSFLSCVSQLS